QNTADHSTNEIVFVIIPHIIRGPELFHGSADMLDVGTANAIQLRPANKVALPANTAPAVGLPGSGATGTASPSSGASGAVQSAAIAAPAPVPAPMTAPGQGGPGMMA